MSEEQNLADLFANLNQISANTILRERTGGGKGGSAMPLEGNQDPNPLIKFNPFLGKNVTSFQEGGTMLMKQLPSPYNQMPFRQQIDIQNFRPNPIQQQIDLQNENQQFPFGRGLRPEIQKKLGSILKKRRTGESMTQEEQDNVNGVLDYRQEVKTLPLHKMK